MVHAMNSQIETRKFDMHVHVQRKAQDLTPSDPSLPCLTPCNGRATGHGQHLFERWRVLTIPGPTSNIIVVGVVGVGVDADVSEVVK